MKDVFNSILASFSMFSKIPVRTKSLNWDPNGMRYIMASYPLIGVVIGALMFAWLYVCGRFSAPPMLRALGITLLPIAVTGGLHLDGLCDTCDALGANVSPERRREILKDPRAGAFGVIGVVTHLLASFALACAVEDSLHCTLALCLSFVVSRTISAMAVVGLPASGDGSASRFKTNASKATRVVLYVFLLLCVVAIFLVGIVENWSLAVAWPIAALAAFLSLERTAKRKFGGMSGDLAGWFLQRCELWQLTAIVLATWIGGVIA